MLPSRYVARSPGGILIGSFGYVGDDFGAVEATFQALNAQLSAPNAEPQAEILDETVRLSTCFREAYGPKTRSLRGPIVWTASLDGLSWALADGRTRTRLLRRLQDLAPRPRFLVLEAAPQPELERLLAQAGVQLRFASAEHQFLIEITRPDGHIISAFCADEPETRLEQAAYGGRPMLFAPHLTARVRTLAAQRKRAELIEALLAHPASLVFGASSASGIQPVHWDTMPDPLLPVYPDVSTWVHAKAELPAEPALSMATNEAQPLLRWLCDRGWGLAVGWRSGEPAELQHVGIDHASLLSLCDQAMRKRGWAEALLRMLGLARRASKRS